MEQEFEKQVNYLSLTVFFPSNGLVARLFYVQIVRCILLGGLNQ